MHASCRSSGRFSSRPLPWMRFVENKLLQPEFAASGLTEAEFRDFSIGQLRDTPIATLCTLQGLTCAPGTPENILHTTPSPPEPSWSSLNTIPVSRVLPQRYDFVHDRGCVENPQAFVGLEGSSQVAGVPGSREAAAQRLRRPAQRRRRPSRRAARDILGNRAV